MTCNSRRHVSPPFPAVTWRPARRRSRRCTSSPTCRPMPPKLQETQKACILMWLGGGPPTIDIWDLKPGSKNGGEFKPIATTGDLQICEHMPKTAKVMDNCRSSAR